MKFGKRFSGNKHANTEKVDRLTMKERLAAFTYLPAFFRLIWQAGPTTALANTVLRILKSFTPFAFLYVSKLIIDQVALFPQGKSSMVYTGKLVLLAFALAVLTDILYRMLGFLDSMLGDLFTNYTSIKIMTHAATLDLEQFEDAAFYDKLERARKQTVGSSILLSLVLGQLQDIITITFFSAGLILFNPWLILFVVVSVLPGFVGEYYFNGKHYHLIRSQTEGRRELEYLRFVGASIETAKEVKLFNLSDFFINRFRSLSGKFYVDNRRLSLKQAIVGSSLGLFGSLGYCAALVIIVRSVYKGHVSIGDFTFMIGSFQQVRGISSELMKNFNTISKGIVQLGDFFLFFNIKPKIVVSSNSIHFPNPIKHGFTFENVGFKYEHANKWANRHLNFTIRAGEKLALVGENGAGKTTLVKLLTRLYDPTEGRILLDGVDLKHYNLSELRMQIGIIFQDFYHYQMTSSLNIAVGNIDEKNNHPLIKSSAEKSLAAPVIEALPHGYDQVLGKYFKNGTELSGGQWQKIALARAYMRTAQLVILDEPTASLDAKAEYRIFQQFAELSKTKSAILISHRFSTVKMVDRILVLEKGELIETGSHQELLRLRGRYAEMFELQANGYK